ncbi:hypothetical protein [Sorangium sp. So ce128]|uniref:hypothetical protein n=1 Tax=Sorangium sp. So ce128 TaxID=3133281 RepID=UPI003F5F0937
MGVALDGGAGCPAHGRSGEHGTSAGVNALFLRGRRCLQRRGSRGALALRRR